MPSVFYLEKGREASLPLRIQLHHSIKFFSGGMRHAATVLGQCIFLLMELGDKDLFQMA